MRCGPACSAYAWARRCGSSAEELSEIYYQALLRYIGCNAETYSLVALFGDELALRRDFALVDTAKAGEMANMVLRHLRGANADAGTLEAAFTIAKGFLVAQRVSADNIAAHCEAADRLAERLSLGPAVRRNLGQIYERWDGRGLPGRLKGEAIAPAVRVVVFAHDVVVLRAAYGPERVADLLKKRRGRIYDPRIVDCFLADHDRFVAVLDEESSWDAVLALEPQPRRPLVGARSSTKRAWRWPISPISSRPTRWAIRATSRDWPPTRRRAPACRRRRDGRQAGRPAA